MVVISINTISIQDPVSIILNVMVKDEIDSLPILLESVKDYVTDYVIVDTGSSDGTVEMLEARNMTIHRKEFEDFGTTRNHALRLALAAANNKPAYIMLVDADFELVVEDRQRFISMLQDYEYDVISIIQKVATTQYRNVRLVKADLIDTHWVGAVHEYLHTNGQKYYDLPTEVSTFHKVAVRSN